MTDPNAEALHAARALVKQRNNKAHWRAIDDGEWDSWGAVQAALHELLSQPVMSEGED